MSLLLVATPATDIAAGGLEKFDFRLKCTHLGMSWDWCLDGREELRDLLFGWLLGLRLKGQPGKGGGGVFQSIKPGCIFPMI